MTERKPRDEEIDVHGVACGKVRSRTRITSFSRRCTAASTLFNTNLSERERLPLGDQRLAFMAMVADGVGGATGESVRARSRSRPRRNTS